MTENEVPKNPPKAKDLQSCGIHVSLAKIQTCIGRTEPTAVFRLDCNKSTQPHQPSTSPSTPTDNATAVTSHGFFSTKCAERLKDLSLFQLHLYLALRSDQRPFQAVLVNFGRLLKGRPKVDAFAAERADCTITGRCGRFGPPLFTTEGPD